MNLSLRTLELMEALRDALLAEANDLPNRAFDRALARGLSVREAAKPEEGGNISADEAARRLGISKTSVLEKFKKGQLEMDELSNL
jgi:transposase